jgi:hypothetical protein
MEDKHRCHCKAELSTRQMFSVHTGLRCTFRQYYLHLSLIDNGAWDDRLNGDANDIQARAGVVPGRVCEGRVPSKGEREIPATHDGIPWAQLKCTIFLAFGGFGQGGRNAQTRRRHVANKVIIICGMNSGGKVEGQGGNDMWWYALIIGLALVYEARKVPLESIDNVRTEPGNANGSSVRRPGVA